jgi:hypothetical protein
MVPKYLIQERDESKERSKKIKVYQRVVFDLPTQVD